MTNLAVVLLIFMKKRLSYLLCFLLIITTLCSCKTTGHSEKYYEKQEAKKAENEQKAYETIVENHKKVQSKSTQKAMKKLERESKKMNKSRKPKLKSCST
jgi:hypothetical protein